MPRTILIADNNAFYRQVLGDFFRSEGYEVAIAADGMEALEKVSAGGVDFVLLDLIMPRIDGARLCRYIKSQPGLSSIPVVILSGILADEIDGIESINADAYVAKMPMDQLQSMLRKVFAALDGRPAEPVLEGFEKMYRREVVLELLEERRGHDVILNAIAEGIVEMNVDRRVLKTNRVFDRMVGLSGTELLSRPIDALFPQARPAIDALFQSLDEMNCGPSSTILAHEGRSLRLRLHRLAAGLAEPTSHAAIRKAAEENPKVRLLDLETLPGFVMLIEDVTEQMRAQEERDRFREKMARSERMSAFGIFVGGAAHELNNPLTAVLGYSQLLAGRQLPEDLKEPLRKIEAGATRCKAIVENLLVFSRRGKPEKRPEHINRLVRAAILESSADASVAGVDIETQLGEPLPLVEVNAEEIVQALVAVLDNAIRAAGALTGKRAVRVRTSTEDGFIKVDVCDTGPGIPREILPKIFDPFFGTRGVGQGKGLGLSVAYGIVRSHAGSLSARNLPDGGASLTIRMPCGALVEPETAGDPAPDGEQRPRAGSAPRRRNARILIVDDEPVVLDLLTDLLAPLYEVETASNGRDGLSRLSRESYDLIILDIKMPDMTGRQMYEALLAMRPSAAERVVFTTGDIVHEETHRFLERVGNPCLAKPFSLEALTDLVERCLSASGVL